MTRPVHITSVRRDPPDLDRFVAALLALAIARVEAEQEQRPSLEEPARENERD
jgi:hypothetical protein